MWHSDIFVNVHIKQVCLLYVHFKGGGDVCRVQLVPAAVEPFGVGVGSTGDCGLPRRNYTRIKTRQRATHLAKMYTIIMNYPEFQNRGIAQTERATDTSEKIDYINQMQSSCA